MITKRPTNEYDADFAEEEIQDEELKELGNEDNGIENPSMPRDGNGNDDDLFETEEGPEFEEEEV